MDELEHLRDLRAGLPPARAVARAYARGRLLARVEEGECTRPRRRLAWLGARPRLLAVASFAGAVGLGVLALGAFNSGGQVESAAAKVLHETATVAATADVGLPAPGSGELLYAKTRNLGLWSWDAEGKFVAADSRADGSEVFTAVVSTELETWTSADGTRRVRETLGAFRFPADAERSRWEAAGSPLPGKFDPNAEAAHAKAFGHVLREGGRVLELRRGVVDLELANRHGSGTAEAQLPDTADLPTESNALRRAVHGGAFSPIVIPVGGDASAAPPADPKTLDTEETIFGLWTILSRSTIAPTRAALRAAAFDALAEMPGIELSHSATDLAGRTGEAIRYPTEDSGLRHELIFDSASSRALGQRTVLIDPARGFAKADLSAGTVVDETAYVESAIVDSISETPTGGEVGRSTGNTGPSYRNGGEGS